MKHLLKLSDWSESEITEALNRMITPFYRQSVAIFECKTIE